MFRHFQKVLIVKGRQKNGMVGGVFNYLYYHVISFSCILTFFFFFEKTNAHMTWVVVKVKISHIEESLYTNISTIAMSPNAWCRCVEQYRQQIYMKILCVREREREEQGNNQINIICWKSRSLWYSTFRWGKRRETHTKTMLSFWLLPAFIYTHQLITNKHTHTHTQLNSCIFNMRFLALPSLKRRLLKPCRKMVQLLFKLRLRSKPLSIKSRRRRLQPTEKRGGGRLSKMMSAFRPRRDEREMDRVTELTSFSDAPYHQKAPHPSPLTPAYIRMSAAARVDVEHKHEHEHERDHVEDACRSFEKYLIEMIVEEGKMRDLGDVEEVLHCWKELRSPVFLDLVCRFYRELCTDLFYNHTWSSSIFHKLIHSFSQ